MKRNVKSPQRLERWVYVHIVLTGSVATLGYGKFQATVVRNGTGDYTLTLTNPSNQKIHAQATPYAANRFATIGTRTASTVEILVLDNANTAQDCDVGVMILCNDGTDQY